jgi:hypothetical protein
MPSKELFFSRSIGGFAAQRAGKREYLGRLRLPKPLHGASPSIRARPKHRRRKVACAPHSVFGFG